MLGQLRQCRCQQQQQPRDPGTRFNNNTVKWTLYIYKWHFFKIIGKRQKGQRGDVLCI